MMSYYIIIAYLFIIDSETISISITIYVKLFIYNL